jgi:hypothetical protein
MKRSSLIIFALAVATLPIAVHAQNVSVVVNGQPVTFAQPPIVRAGRVFVPLRGVFERLGASVVYSNGQINATAHGRSISLTIGSTQATVDGQQQTIDVAPFIIGATTFVPLRFISQALGAAVNWNDSTSTVTIASAGQPPPPVPGPRPIRFVSVWPTGTIYNASPVIRFGFDRPIAVEAARVWVDGRNVTPGLHQTGPTTFTINLPWPLPYGPHRVRVTGTTERGASFELFWSFVRG